MKIIKKLTARMEQMFQNDLRFTKGAAHCHSVNSLDDGCQTELDMCKVSKELGAEVAFISDHGTAMGWDDFDEAAEKVGIRPIFGIEAYYLDDVTKMNSHLVLYAKNDEGLKQICKAMSRGHILDDGRTVLTDETLDMLKGGNVVATSACIAGVLGSMIIYNDRLDRRVQKLQNEIEAFADSLAIHQEVSMRHKDLTERWMVAKSEMSESKKASTKSFTAKEKTMAKLKEKLDKANEIEKKVVSVHKCTVAIIVLTVINMLGLTALALYETGIIQMLLGLL